MVFTGTFLLVVCIVFLVLWISSLTVVFLRMRQHYSHLVHGADRQTLTSVLEKILERQKRSDEQFESIHSQLESLRIDGLRHIQHIGIVRFNPFADTGGSQSFSFALLDGHGDGVVITSLYARTGNRWYLKEVEKRKGKTLELSKEEREAINAAHMVQS